MIKYRIVKMTQANGATYFEVQKRMWYIWGTATLTKFTAPEKALEYIGGRLEEDAACKVVKAELVEWRKIADHCKSEILRDAIRKYNANTTGGQMPIVPFSDHKDASPTRAGALRTAGIDVAAMRNDAADLCKQATCAPYKQAAPESLMGKAPQGVSAEKASMAPLIVAALNKPDPKHYPNVKAYLDAVDAWEAKLHAVAPQAAQGVSGATAPSPEYLEAQAVMTVPGLHALLHSMTVIGDPITVQGAARSWNDTVNRLHKLKGADARIAAMKAEWQSARDELGLWQRAVDAEGLTATIEREVEGLRVLDANLKGWVPVGGVSDTSMNRASMAYDPAQASAVGADLAKNWAAPLADAAMEQAVAAIEIKGPVMEITADSVTLEGNVDVSPNAIPTPAKKRGGESQSGGC